MSGREVNSRGLFHQRRTNLFHIEEHATAKTNARQQLLFLPSLQGAQSRPTLRMPDAPTKFFNVNQTIRLLSHTASYLHSRVSFGNGWH
jgi:hypothetical protein